VRAEWIELTLVGSLCEPIIYEWYRLASTVQSRQPTLSTKMIFSSAICSHVCWLARKWCTHNAVCGSSWTVFRLNIFFYKGLGWISSLIHQIITTENLGYSWTVCSVQLLPLEIVYNLVIYDSQLSKLFLICCSPVLFHCMNDVGAPWMIFLKHTRRYKSVKWWIWVPFLLILQEKSGIPSLF
jgi:hypothetical protein